MTTRPDPAHLLRAGAARTVITPPAGHAIHGPEHEPFRSVGVRDDLLARALVLSTGDESAVVITLDVWGLAPALVQSICEQTAKAVKCDPRLVWVSCTGNATGPNLWARDEEYVRYSAYLPELCAGAAASAFQAMGPAGIGGAVARVPGVSTNVAGRGHDADQAVAVVSVIGENDRPIARVVSFACPASVSSADGAWTADWPGYAAWALDQSAGGITLFSRGADGDIRPFDWWSGNPSPTHAERLVSDVQALGLLIATQAAQAAARAQMKRNVTIGWGADPAAGLRALRVGDAVFISSESPQPSTLTSRLRGSLARATVIMSANIRGDPFGPPPGLDESFLSAASGVARSAGAG